MDCKHARLLLEVAHPLATELDLREQEALAGHLAECPECGALAGSERRLDDHVGKAMRDLPIPADLSQRIIRRLNVDRDAWYRGWAVRAAGVAAVLFLAVWMSWAFWWGKKPALDLHVLNDDFNAIGVMFNADDVEQYFAAKGVTMTAPRKFDYNFLSAVGRAEIQGVRVPYLHFFTRQVGNSNQPAVAYIYVISDRSFDTSALSPVKLTGSRMSTEVFPDPQHPGISYLAVYSGEDLGVFVRRVSN